MGKPCIAFEMEDPRAAHAHMNLERIIDYGDFAYGHWLQPWDDGGRRLCRCKACGGYVLVQDSEFHSTYGNDSYYTDFYPVSGPEEADQLNRLYDGLELENKFPRKFLGFTGMRLHWRGIRQQAQQS